MTCLAIQLPGRCVVLGANEVTIERMPVTLHYEVTRPFEIAITFGSATSWVVGRDLLVDGVTIGSAGVLDVVVTTYAMPGGDSTVIGLQPPGVAPADVVLPTAPLAEFLARTEDLVPPGTEVALEGPCCALWYLGAGEHPDQDSDRGLDDLPGLN